MSETVNKNHPLWKRILFSPVILEKSDAQKIAYIGVMTALCIIANMWEIKSLDFQFSITIFASVLAGMLIGPIFGSVAAFLGDFLGFVVNSWGLTYYFWVAISCAMMAVIAGLIIRLPLNFKGSAYVKLTIISLLVLIVCSVGINTTGLYLWSKHVSGFSESIFSVIEQHFGGQMTYWAYALARLVFKGQLVNNLLNFALLFVAVPLLSAVKPLKLNLR